MVDTALKINPSLCISSPRAWAQPFTVRGKAFMHQATHIPLFLYNQINLKCLQPNLHGEFQLNSGILARAARCKGAEIRTLGPVTSIRTKNKNSWYAIKGCRVQKLGPWVWFCGGLFNGVEAG